MISAFGVRRLIESLYRVAVGPAGHDQLNGLIGVDAKPDDSPAGGDQLHDIRVVLFRGAALLTTSLAPGCGP